MNLENLVRGQILALIASHQKRYNDLIKHMSNGNDERFRYFTACEKGCAKIHWFMQQLEFPFPDPSIGEIADWYCEAIIGYGKCLENFACFGDYAVIASSAASRLCDEVTLFVAWMYE